MIFDIKYDSDDDMNDDSVPLKMEEDSDSEDSNDGEPDDDHVPVMQPLVRREMLKMTMRMMYW